MRLLARTAAARKGLVIMSDGLAEDYAYHHDDVISLARAERVIIHSVGYPRSVAKSVALQTVRRLSDETGGSGFSDCSFRLSESIVLAETGL